MSGVYLELEVYGGAEIEQVARQAVSVASILGISVWFNFNGVRCNVGGGDTPRDIAELQQCSQRLGYEYLGQSRNLTPEKRAEVLAVLGPSRNQGEVPESVSAGARP